MEKQALILLLFLVSCSPSVSFDSVSFNVDVAMTDEEKSRGLMFRESMPDDYGMLFVFDDFAMRSFWMKNTRIPLDIIFLDGDLAVVDIWGAEPCIEDPCPSYSAPAMYVLEINAGLAEKYGIVNGSRMSR